ncbi:MAG TPA: ribosomal RNA small subunit methyltransferase A [Phycisphaerales bacterium]|nr:ribosomal RNA small subunit methyltransferase A [Phycisphaerales bacterium]HCD31028.1 ribosomal RNA small subunit methyltransferase A [Phycisphaerales bacterium]|tara:strand:+ start:2477 stop:3292 length:816 start_codon:yes stop_codon:yes gene_type:complete
MAQTLGQIKLLLDSFGLRPKKRFGQNFLHDGNKMQAILQAGELTAGELVLEVGAGTGALTGRLLDAGAKVVAVEVDKDLWPILDQQFAEQSNLTVIQGDVLQGKHHLNPQVIEQLGDKPFKLIANLPYNVASPLLINLVTQFPAMSHAIVMVQKEVADRLAAKPGSKTYGPMGIIVGATCDVQEVCTLSPSCFWPQPGVHSSVILVKRKPMPITEDMGPFVELVHLLFGKRRKQLGAILGRDQELPQGITYEMRPEVLSVEQLAALARMWS